MGDIYVLNETLNKLDCYKNLACSKCGRKYPETILNIEGRIHHGCDLLCLDTKACNKFAKKKRLRI